MYIKTENWIVRMVSFILMTLLVLWVLRVFGGGIDQLVEKTVSVFSKHRIYSRR